MSSERYTVKADEKGFVSEDRVFKNGKCIYNTRLGIAYSVDETVEVLNELDNFGDFLSELIQAKIWYCQGKYKETFDEKYLIEEQCLKNLREESHDCYSYKKYATYLRKRHATYLKKKYDQYLKENEGVK